MKSHGVMSEVRLKEIVILSEGISSVLRQKRAEKNLTLEGLGEEAKMCKSTISRLERKKIHPKYTVFWRLSHTLGLKVKLKFDTA